MIERRTITDRQSWLAWRRQDVTASDVAALFGLSPFKTPLRLWAEKTGRAPEPFETPAMRRGRWLEPAVIEAFKEEFPTTKVERSNVYVRDPVLRLGATPDAIAGDALIECKVISRPVFEAWQGECPVYYQLQALTGAMLMECRRAMVACLVIDTFSASLEVFHVELSAQAEARIFDGVVQFWNDIAEGIIPEPDYGEDGTLLAELYRPKDEIAAIDLSGDNLLADNLFEYESLASEIRAREERRGAIKAEVIDKLKGAPAAICGDWKISHRTQHRKEMIVKASTYSVLQINRRKDKAA